MSRSLSLWLALALLAAGCGGDSRDAAPTPAAGSADERWDAFARGFIEATFVAQPSFAVAQGRHDFDGKVADLSRAGVAAAIARLQKAREAALGFREEELDDARRFERDYLLAQIDGSLFWQERARQQEHSPLVYADAVDPSIYVTRDYAPLDRRMAAYIDHAQEIPRVVEQMKAGLKPPLPRPFVEVGLQVVRELGPYLQKDVVEIFSGVADPALQARLREVNTRAVAALASAVEWLESQLASADESFALGPELFREMLWATERVDTPLDALESLARKDMEQNLRALAAECVKIAPNQPLTACVEAVTRDKPAEGAVVGARQQLDMLKRFIVERDLVSIPAADEARVEEAPPYKRWNQAYIDIPGPFETGTPAIYYIAPPDPKWSEADRLAYLPGAADLLFITVHEVWPGHFLQFLHAKRVERSFGRIFVGYAFAEGWAHYAEEMVWEAGLSNGDPKVHVGQLLNALLRNARFLSAIGLHTQGMTLEQSVALFREDALQDPANAQQQAARGTFDPAYLNYTLGKLMIRKLRDDWTRTRGGRSAWRAFHDRLLSYGGPPLPLVRKALLGDASPPL